MSVSRQELTPPSVLAAAALNLGRAGYRIFPLPVGMKGAKLKDWPNLATTDAATITQWWNEQPQANVAIVGGNGLLILDVDPRHGGYESLTTIQQLHGLLPATLTALTPSGGMHMYFAGPDVSNSNDGRVGAGLDIKSRGGYVVAAPSETVAIADKQSAGTYMWLDVSVGPAPAPQWLIDLAGTPRVATASAAVPVFKLRDATPEQWADIRSALDHLAKVGEVASNALWSKIGYALQSLGDDARSLWCEWSERAPGYSPGAPEHWWDTHNEGASDFRALFNIAAEYGWKNPASRAASPVTMPPPPVAPAEVAAPTVAALMLMNRKNQYEANLENLVHVLGVQRQATLGHDDFRSRMMLAPQGSDAWRPITDTDMIQLRERLARERGFAPISKELMRDALQMVADRYAFDSATTWLNGLTWDGVPRVARFLADYCGAADDDYAQAVSLYIWSGLTGRVLSPGCQLDMVVALQSPQGRHKSTGLQAMVPDPDWFTDGLSLQQDDDDFRRLIRGKLVIEIAEMVGLSKADIPHVKQVITRRTEEWIEKYATQPTRYPRRCMFFATTNEERFLPADDTGQRRWLPVEVQRLDRERIAADRLQLWAEGAAIWRQHGVQWRAAEDLASGRHAKYEAGDVWETDIERWLAMPTPPPVAGQVPLPPPGERTFAISDVLTGALRLNPSAQDARAEKRAARVLRLLGYEKRDVKADGRSVKRWMRQK